jgi:hypothetical protein
MSGEGLPQDDLPAPATWWQVLLGGVAVAMFLYAFIWCFALLAWLVES